jgi:hypothetical protein
MACAWLWVCRLASVVRAAISVIVSVGGKPRASGITLLTHMRN